jgi:hypothetical protein
LIHGAGSGGLNRLVTFATELAKARERGRAFPFVVDFVPMDSNAGDLNAKRLEITRILGDNQSIVQPFLVGSRGYGSGGDSEWASRKYDEIRPAYRQFIRQQPYLVNASLSVFGKGGTGLGIAPKVLEDNWQAGIISFGFFAQTACGLGNLLPFDSKRVQAVIGQLDQSGYPYSLGSNDKLGRRGISQTDSLAQLDQLEALSIIDLLEIITNPTRLIDPMDVLTHFCLVPTERSGNNLIGKRVRVATKEFAADDLKYEASGDNSDELKVGGISYAPPTELKELHCEEWWNLKLARAVAEAFENRYYIDDKRASTGAILAAVRYPGELDSADEATIQMMLVRLCGPTDTDTTNTREEFEPFQKLAVYPNNEGDKVQITIFTSPYTGKVDRDTIPPFNLDRFDYIATATSAAAAVAAQAQLITPEASVMGENNHTALISNPPTPSLTSVGPTSGVSKTPPVPSDGSAISQKTRFETFGVLVNAAFKSDNQTAKNALFDLSPELYPFTDRTEANDRWRKRDIMSGLKLMADQPQPVRDKFPHQLAVFLIGKLKEDGFVVSRLLRVGSGKKRIDVTADADEQTLTHARNETRNSLGASEGVTEEMRSELSIRSSFARIWGQEILAQLPVEEDLSSTNKATKSLRSRIATSTMNLAGHLTR